MFTPNLGFTILYVENPMKSGQFYQDILGIEPVHLSATFVLFALENGVKLGLWSKYTAEPKVEGHPGGAEISFSAQDVDALYADCEKKCFTIAQKPTDMDFGRTFVFLDPDGHRIRIYKLHEQVS